MVIPTVYWTILGEIALVLIGVLIAVIVVILKDRKKLKEYSFFLKDTIKDLKKKIQVYEAQQNQERVQELLKALIEHVRQQYQSLYGNEVASLETENDQNNPLSVEKFILIAGYQTIIAELSALENSNEPEVTWEKIKSELTPLIKNYLNPVLAAQSAANVSIDEDDDSLNSQLDNANQRITSLEKFKQLYFDLQGRLSTSMEDIEALNQKIAELAAASDNSAEIMAIIEKNKTHYLNIGQMIGMDKNQHHKSVAEKMDYSDELIHERQNEINRLKHKISQQFEEIWSLQNRVSNGAGQNPNPAELSAGIEVLTRNLKDAEMCIETMDMEIQTLTSEISNLKSKLQQQGEGGAASSEFDSQIREKDQMISRFAQESKELMNCITGLEDSSSEQNKTIAELESKLKEKKALEDKYAKLEAKYLEAMK